MYQVVTPSLVILLLQLTVSTILIATSRLMGINVHPNADLNSPVLLKSSPAKWMLVSER
jgi:hypothetical protein